LLKSIELQNNDEDTTADVCSLNTHAFYLMRAYLAILPPAGFAAMAMDTRPLLIFLQEALAMTALALGPTVFKVKFWSYMTMSLAGKQTMKGSEWL
jgi:hypothetical protein